MALDDARKEFARKMMREIKNTEAHAVRGVNHYYNLLEENHKTDEFAAAVYVDRSHGLNFPNTVAQVLEEPEFNGFVEMYKDDVGDWRYSYIGPKHRNKLKWSAHYQKKSEENNEENN